MQQFMPSPMTVVAAVQPPTTPQQQQQQTPNMILYESIQNSSWYHGLPSSSKMQVNQSVTHLVTALNNFQRERRLNPTIVFDIFKLDNAIELLDIMKNLSIFVDMNGNIIKQQPQQPPQPQVTSYAGHPCQQQISPGPQTQQTCNAMYSFIQQVLAPAAQCGARMPCSASSSMHEPFVSCYVDPPRTATMSSSCCGGHKHQHEEPITSNASPHPPAEDNYNDNRRGNYNNQFRKPYNQNQSQKPYNNQRFNNNPRFSKPFAYGSGNGNGGGGGDSFSPTRTSSPPLQQSFSPRGGGGGGVGRYNRRQQTIGCDGGSSWASSSSSPPSSSAKPFNNNRRFNRNNNFNRNSSYGNNNSSSPTRATSPPSSRYGNYNKSSSPPLPDQKSPPPLSPRRPDMPPQRATSPVLSSPVKQKQPPSTDEECWD